MLFRTLSAEERERGHGDPGHVAVCVGVGGGRNMGRQQGWVHTWDQVPAASG